MTSSADGAKPPTGGAGKLPGVNTVRRRRADGRVAVDYYHRATGTRLDGAPGSEEFRRSWEAAERGLYAAPPAPPARMFADLVDDFLKSPEHQSRAPRTRHAREVALEAAKRRFDWVKLDDLNKRGIREEIFLWRDEMRDLPRKADDHVSTLRRVLSWGYDRGILEFNHGLHIGRLVPGWHNRAERLWTPELEERLLAAAKPDLADAWRLSRWTAARMGDLVALEWAQFDGRWLSFRPGKTRASAPLVWVHLPVWELPPLAELIAGLSRATDRILSTEHAHPWTVTNLQRQYQNACAAAGIGPEDDVTWNDARGTTGSELLDAGCTDAEADAILGHALGGETQLRAYAARSRTLATNAYRKWAAALGRRDNVTVLMPVRKNG